MTDKREVPVYCYQCVAGPDLMKVEVEDGSPPASFPISTCATSIPGAAVVGGGVTWKLTLISRAGFQQGFALDRWPQRGSGRRAARGAI